MAFNCLPLGRKDVMLEIDMYPYFFFKTTISNVTGSRLYALWNRSAGDCLLDAVSQAAYGVFDSDNTLRRALADSLQHAARAFYDRYNSFPINMFILHMLRATRDGPCMGLLDSTLDTKLGWFEAL